MLRSPSQPSYFVSISQQEAGNNLQINCRVFKAEAIDDAAVEVSSLCDAPPAWALLYTPAHARFQILEGVEALSGAGREREVDTGGNRARYRLRGVRSYRGTQSCARATFRSFAARRDLFVLLVQWTEPMAAVTV